MTQTKPQKGRLFFLTRKELNRQRTMDDIERAFLALYEKTGVDGISISDLCKKSGVSRSTFYLYFDDKYAVLQKVEDRLLSQLWEICGDLPDQFHSHKGTETARSTLEHIRANIGWYKALLGKRGDPMFVYRWKRDIDRSLQKKLAARNVGDQDAALYGVIFASALIGLYTHIVFERPDMPDDKLIGYLDNLLMRTLQGWGEGS